MPQRSPTAVEVAGLLFITIIHQRAEVITITIVTIIPHIVSFTGFPGRIAATPYVTIGGHLSHTVISGRTIIEGLSSSVSAVTGPATHTGVTIGMDGTHFAGMVIIHRNM
jgi:hypothetical protein